MKRLQFFESHGRRRAGARARRAIAVLLVLTSFSSAAWGAPTSAQRCTAAKLKATAKKQFAKVGCHEKALLKNLPVDPECLAKAEGKFALAFARAEAKGGCITTADAAAIEERVDEFVADLTVALPLAPKRVFQTLLGREGDFGGLASADAACQSEADDAGLTGTYKAWLSDSTISAASRLTHASVPYQLVNGTTIAADWTDLTDGTLDAPIDLSADGGMTALANVWTGTEADGTASPNNCSNWTSSSTSLIGDLGSEVTSSGWSAFGSGNCGEVPGFYCFEQ